MAAGFLATWVFELDLDELDLDEVDLDELDLDCATAINPLGSIVGMLRIAVAAAGGAAATRDSEAAVNNPRMLARVRMVYLRLKLRLT